MSDIFLVATFLGVIVAGVLAVQVMNWMTRRKWRAHEQYPILAAELGFERTRDRFLIDTRIQRYHGRRHGWPTEIEVGAGPQGVYLRVDYEFERTVDLGMRISSEHEDGFMTRVMRLREIEVGHELFDSQFILLSRDEERLRDLLDKDVRHMLLDLGGSVRDLRLNDDGLHLQIMGELDDEQVRRLIDRGAQLASAVFARAEKLQQQRREEQNASDVFSPVTGTHQAIPVVDAELGR